MSIKIHHGPPGSYKTSGAVMDDFLPCVAQGRLVITNVRGLTLDRVKTAMYPLTRFERYIKKIAEPYQRVFPEVPEDFDIIHLDTTLKADRDKLAIWFHWAPKHAFFLIDEAQSVFSPRWTAKDIAALDYPGRSMPHAQACALVVHHEGEKVFGEVHAEGGWCSTSWQPWLSGNDGQVTFSGVDAARLDDRPATWSDALEMHRHFGWDMTLTTPNIKSLRGDVREVAEGAYKHRNLAIVGLSGRYMQGFHDAQDSGLPSHMVSLVSKRISKQVWGLYDSTTTGTHSDTLAGIQLWKDPKILGLVAIVAVALIYVFSRPLPAVLGGKKPPEAAAHVPLGAAEVPAQKNRIAGNTNALLHVPGVPARSGGGLAEVMTAKESEWQAIGYYLAGGKHFVTLRRDGVVRTVINPKDAKYDSGRIDFQLDGQLVSNFTGRRGNAGNSDVAQGVKF